MPGKKQLDSDSSALCGGAALAGTTPKGVGPPNGGQTLVRVVASQTFAYETKRGWRTFWIYYLYAPKKLTCLNLTENKNPLLSHRLIILFQKAVFVYHRFYQKINVNRKFTWQYWCVEKFPFKFFDKMVNKTDFLKIISLKQKNGREWQIRNHNISLFSLESQKLTLSNKRTFC